MNDLVTLAQAQDHLRDYYAANEPDIKTKITQASAAVLDYMKFPEGSVMWDADSAPPLVQAAVLLTLSWLFDDRTGGDNVEGQVALGYLPQSVTDLLHRMRDPALA
jgi:hypothetical protein